MDINHIHSDLKNKFRISNATTNHARIVATVLMCNSVILIHIGYSSYIIYAFWKSISYFGSTLTSFFHFFHLLLFV